MKNIQSVIILAICTLILVSCQKDKELSSFNSATFNEAVISNTANNQPHTHRKGCSAKHQMEEKLQDPVFRAAYEERMANFSRRLRRNTATSRSACSSPTILPVAIHYQGVSNPDKACLRTLAKEEIARLNADIQGKNSDLARWRNTTAASYPGITNGGACMSFQIATRNHPAGAGLSDGTLAITFNQTNGDSAPKWAGYINIFVGDADGSLGYAPLGGAGDGDGVMISSEGFGNGTGCSGVRGVSPNDLGRTLTHEIGHYLNLDHLWGDGGCSSDDQVADTPNQEEANYGCPSSAAACTGGQALHMNFMDYADDACMYMFTAGQASRMESWLQSGLFNSLKKATDVIGAESGIADSGNTPTGDNGTTTTGDTTDAGNTNNGDDTTTEGDNANDGDIFEEEEEDIYGEYEEDGAYEEEEAAGSGTISIEVTLDDFGSETTFDMEDGDGEVIASWGPFQDEQAGTVITRNIDLPTGIYTFVIYDDFGDGICCSAGDGQWTLLQDGTPIKSSNGDFGDWEEYDFAVGNARLSAPAHRVDPKDFTELAKKTKPILGNVAHR